MSAPASSSLRACTLRLPSVTPSSSFNSVKVNMAFTASALTTPITAGAWEAAYWSAQASLTGLDHLRAGARSAYVLTRPPGHHAGADFFAAQDQAKCAVLMISDLRDYAADWDRDQRVMMLVA